MFRLSDTLRIECQRAAMRTRWRDLFTQMRPTHWVKNLIVFVPLLTSQQFFNSDAWPGVLLTFVSFCLAASAGYQLNDLVDRESDRLHERKRARPLAAGLVTSGTVTVLGVVCAVLAAALALVASRWVAAIILGYLGFAWVYSAFLKRLPVLDTLCLAALYCARIFAGAAAVDVDVSNYLVAFSLFFFLSLALMKRYATLLMHETENMSASLAYSKHDLGSLRIAGVATALVSLALLAVYINDDVVRARFSSPDLLWGAWLALLYSVLRGWLAASRGKLDDDFVTLALHDRVFWVSGILVVSLFLLAS